MDGADDSFGTSADKATMITANPMNHTARDGAVPHVRCVIVNYRTADLTIDCLRSLADLRATEWANLDVVVVDNASPDGSVPMIRDAIQAGHWHDWITLVAAPTNSGFAQGNNSALALTSAPEPRYFWLLNPDTVVRPGALKPLVARMEREARTGIVGSRLEWPNGDQQHSTFRFPTPLRELVSSFPLGPLSALLSGLMIPHAPDTTAARRDWVSGASMLIRSEVLRDTGPMDASYFLYYEETDLCLQASRKGWQCWFEPESRVVHLVGRSTGVTRRDHPLPRRPAYWFQSRSYYFRKNYGPWTAAAADLALVVAAVVTNAVHRIKRRPSTLPHRFVADLIRYGAIGQSLGLSATDRAKPNPS